MIGFMSTRAATGFQLAFVVTVVVFLLGGRLALATHAYEHDFAESVAECELCEFGHVCSDGAVASNFLFQHLPKGELANVHARRLIVVTLRGIPLPRAPPASR